MVDTDRVVVMAACMINAAAESTASETGITGGSGNSSNGKEKSGVEIRTGANEMNVVQIGIATGTMEIDGASGRI
jgi:hypothetical protein